MATVHHADCLTVMATLPDCSVDSVVTDPPYAVDAVPFDDAALRGLATGSCLHCLDAAVADGFLVCQLCLERAQDQELMNAPMLGMRSQNWSEKATHSRGYADNDPRTFQRWCETWAAECLRVLKPGGHIVAFGGTRTWHRMAVAFEDVGFEMRDTMAWIYGTGYPKGLNVGRAVERRFREAGAPSEEVSRAAGEWEGWGTTVKPAHEPILLARKPLDGTVVGTVLTFRTGALNVGSCTLGTDGDVPGTGRLPTNVYLDDTQGAALERVAPGATRFFWVAKPGSRERVVHNGVAHPTVKPLDLMRELVRLVTPPGGLVLEPFAGSGTTVEACIAEGMSVVAAERDARFVDLVNLRIERATEPLLAARRRDEPEVLDLLSCLDEELLDLPLD